MIMKKLLLLIMALISVYGLNAQILINEIDADTPGTDAAEFIELYNTSASSVDLADYVLVLFNGNGDESYAAYDLDGHSIDANGYFVIGATAGADMAFGAATNALQNGPDAVALYLGQAADWSSSPVTTANLVDAVVYDTNDADDAELLVLLNASQPQINEDEGGDKDNHSLQRNTDGAGGARNTDQFYTRTPTPGASNDVVVGTLTLTSPNGGETYNAGQVVSIQWTASGVDKVNIEVYNNEMQWEVIIADENSQDGANSIPFAIPLNAWDWNGYKLKVVDAANAAVNDDSDAAFTIIGHDMEIFWEDFGSGDLGDFEAISASGDEVWAYGIFSGTTYAAIEGGGNTNEDWLITPAINLDQSTSETFEFTTAVNTYEDNLEVKYSTDYDGQGNPAGATWTKFLSYELSEGGWEWKRTVVDISMLSGDAYVAFIYTSSASIDNKWEVTDIYVSGIGTPTLVDKLESKAINVVPNPFVNEVLIKADNVKTVEFYNASGQLVKNN